MWDLGPLPLEEDLYHCGICSCWWFADLGWVNPDHVVSRISALPANLAEVTSFFFFFLCTQAYGGPQASGQIGAVAAGHSHSQVRSKLCLVTLPPLGAMPLLNPLSEAKDRTCILMDAGQICFC